MKKICKECKKSFYTFRKNQKFCSTKCQHLQPKWNKGLNISDPRIKKMAKKISNMFKHKFYGSTNHHWKGGKYKTYTGYINIYKPNHPFCDSGKYVKEHRLVMEQKLGRNLKPNERVHHINGIKIDNRIENLILFSNESEHQKFHKRKPINQFS